MDIDYRVIEGFSKPDIRDLLKMSDVSRLKQILDSKKFKIFNLVDLARGVQDLSDQDSDFGKKETYDLAIKLYEASLRIPDKEIQESRLKDPRFFHEKTHFHYGILLKKIVGEGLPTNLASLDIHPDTTNLKIDPTQRAYFPSFDLNGNPIDKLNPKVKPIEETLSQYHFALAKKDHSNTNCPYLSI